MKEKELRELCTCAICNRKIGETKNPCFFKVTLERHMLNLRAIQRQQGLAMMLGGNAAIAAVMGPDDEMTDVVYPAKTIMVCDGCATKDIMLWQLAESK